MEGRKEGETQRMEKVVMVQKGRERKKKKNEEKECKGRGRWKKTERERETEMGGEGGKGRWKLLPKSTGCNTHSKKQIWENMFRFALITTTQHNTHTHTQKGMYFRHSTPRNEGTTNKPLKRLETEFFKKKRRERGEEVKKEERHVIHTT